MDLNRKLKRKKERKKRSRKDLRRWAEGDLLQSHRLFPAVMFNYFQSLGTWGFGGKYKQKFSFNTFLFIIWIKHLAHLSSKELKRKRFAGVLMKKRVSPLKDLNMTTGTTKCDCKNPIFLLGFFLRNRSKEDKKNEYREKEDVKWEKSQGVVNVSAQKGDVHWASAQIQTSFWTGERVAIGTLSKAWKWPLKEITLFIMTARSASLPFQTLSKGQSGEG